MKRPMLLPVGTVIALAACSADRPPTSPPDLAVSDGSSFATVPGNPRFYFLPPLVPTPTFSGTFNPGLKPTVVITELLNEADPSCQQGTVVATFHDEITVDPVNEFYQVNWKTGPGNGVFSDKDYRICVRVGSLELGFRDVDPDDSAAEVPRNPEGLPVMAFQNGNNQPIKFRIEVGIICQSDVDCFEGTVDDNGGTFVTGDGFAGVFFSAGWLPDDFTEVTLIIQEVPLGPGETCHPDENVLQFGGESCYSFETDPDVGTFQALVIVAVCLALPESDPFTEFVQLYSSDPGEATTALPSAPEAFLTCDGFGSTLGSASFGGWKGFAYSAWHAVADRVAAVVGPRPLRAALIDIGRGGEIQDFSHVGWGLQGIGTVVSGDGASALEGTAIDVTVQVTANHFDSFEFSSAPPLAGLTLTAAVTGGGGSVAPVSATTDGNGFATFSWTVGVGANTLEITGPLVNSPIMVGATGLQLGVGTPTIDGQFDPATEWITARKFPFLANLSGGGGTTPATLYVMNDATNLYLAVQVERSAADKVNSLQLNFDNNNSWNVDGTGAAEAGDDMLILDASTGFADWYLTLKCTNSNQSSCGAADASDGGSDDGAGAFGNNGVHTTYEIAHPLNSADDAHDFSLILGGKVGGVVTLQQGSGAQGNTQWPGFRQYQEIPITVPLVP